MRGSGFAPFVLLTLAVSAHAAGWNEWEDFYRDVTAWQPDSTQVAPVHSLLLERDACTIALEEGRLALARPLDGRRVAAVFTGRGTLGFVPASEIERQQLRRFYGVTMLRRPIQRLTLVFADSTLAELRAALTFGPDTLGQLATAWRATQPYLTVRHTTMIWPPSVAHMLLDGEGDGLFWAHATGAGTGEPYFFSLDPRRAERVVLERRPDDDRRGLMEFFDVEPVCQFFARGDTDTLRRDERPPYEATNVRIDVNLSSALDLAARADYDLVARRGSREWFAFTLPPRLRIDEVSSPGRTCTVHQERTSAAVWVHVAPPVGAGDAASLAFRYHGRCFERDTIDRIYNTRDWYPQPDVETRALWDVTFHHPRDLQVIGAGERVEEGPEPDGRVRSRWRTTLPVSWTSFAVGFLRGIRVTGDSLPRLAVWSEHASGSGRVREESLAALRGSKGHDERVAADVAGAVLFYQRAWGAAPAGEFNAVESPGSEYAAFPGLIRMMPERDRALPGAQWTPDVTRAHEIAHQWWGLGVAPATYHDVWMAEGFCNFSAIWYLQAGRRDPRSYFDILAAWRRDLLLNRHFLLGEGQEAGPVWLGPRTNSSRTPGDYGLVVYRKGAWVLHMLRNYLLRDDDPEERRFRGMLRDFYQRFAGRRAFTEDFRAAAERAAGEDLGWFFDQWVYGTEVPTYRFTWSARPAAGGSWRVHGSVSQTNVPDSFRMPVVVRVNYADGSFARERVWVTGPVTQFDLPLSPRRPADVVFNDLEGVLCEVVK